MTFVELLLRFLVGYVCGLLIGPLIGGYYSKVGDVSIHGGIAGGLGSVGPYVLLNSIWVQQWMADDVSISSWLSVLAMLTRHNVWVSIIFCILSVAIVEWVGRPAHAEEQLISGSAGSDAVLPARGRRTRLLKPHYWLWLCGPAVAYSLWGHFVGYPTLSGWVRYAIGLLAFVGTIGGLVSAGLSSLGTNNK